MANKRKRTVMVRRKKTPLNSQNGSSPAKKSKTSKKEPANIDIANGDDESYVVESVLGVAIEDGTFEPSFLIRWKGYPFEHSTWEPLENLNDKSIIKPLQPLIDKIANFQESGDTTAKKQTRRGKGKKKVPAKNIEYEVEDILGIWYDHEENNIRYKIKWKGYPLSQSTWEKQDNLTKCSDLLDAISSAVDYFEENYTKVQRPVPKSRGKAKAGGRKRGKAAKKRQKPEEEEEEDEAGPENIDADGEKDEENDDDDAEDDY